MKEVQVYSSWEEYIDSKIKFYAPHDFDVLDFIEYPDYSLAGFDNLKKHLELVNCKRCTIHLVVGYTGVYWWYEDKDVLIETAAAGNDVWNVDVDQQYFSALFIILI